MKENSPHVASAVPSVTSRQSIRYAGTAESKTVEGVTEDYLSVRNRTILEGDFFSQEHLQYYRKVVVIGNQIAKDFFGDSNAVGEKIRIGGQSFEVIGTLVEKGSSMGQNMDEVILLPLTTLQRLIGRTTISNIYFAATDSNSTKLAMAEIESSLRALYGSRADRTNVYFISSMDDLLATINTATQTLTIMLAGIAGISLLVGGIGIMNIMLVSVTERTREIGVRKAMGAKRRDILIQFLIEAVILSLFGGVVGLLLGIGIALGISTFAGWAPYISVSAIIMALTFSISIGIFFGLYPANRASKLDPIEALRYE
jgi:putative ABC transport system permease protein